MADLAASIATRPRLCAAQTQGWAVSLHMAEALTVVTLLSCREESGMQHLCRYVTTHSLLSVDEGRRWIHVLGIVRVSQKSCKGAHRCTWLFAY